jgi:hypothetical protein
MYDTSLEVFCPMAKATIKCGQCVQLHFELMGAFEADFLMTLVKTYRLQVEEIEDYCNKCEYQPFKKAKKQEEEAKAAAANPDKGAS